MSTTPLTSTVIPNKYSIPLYLTLIAAGLAGNYFKFPIFFSCDFIFGSVFAMLALQLFGLGRGILAAAIIASYTWFIWNHPYAIIILTAEVAIVGLLMKSRKIGLIQADALFWLLVGMPLVYLVYHFILKIPPSNALFIITKLAVNGVANVLLVRIVYTCYALWSRSSLISYREIVYNLLLFFVLCPTLIMLAVESRSDFNETDIRIRTTLIQDSQSVEQSLKNWVNNRITAIADLAEMASSRSPQQMQPYLERAKRADVNFLYVALRDRVATTTAIFPLLDERGEQRIGKNYADRGYFLQLKRTFKPMLSEIVMGKVGTPNPRVLALAPVVVGGEFRGYVAGSMDLEQIRGYLNTSIGSRSERYTLIDKTGNVIMSNRPDQKVMTPFARGNGTLKSTDAGISQWLPAVPPHTPNFERWKKSYYVAETAIGNPAEWKLILEQPVAPFQKILFDQYSRKLTLLFLILTVTLALAEFLSRRIVVTLGQLRTLTFDLPVRMVKDETEILWPESGIKETNHLINNFREMAKTLSVQYNEILLVKESLELRVAERTKTLSEREEAYRIVADFAYDWEYWIAPDRSFRYISPSCEEHTGYSAEEFRHDPELLYRIIHADERNQLRVHLPEGSRSTDKPKHHQTDFRICTKNGEERWFAHICQPVYDSEGNYLGQRATNRDITDRRQMEEEIIRSLQEKEVLLKEIHHRVKNNMQVIYSLLNLQANGIADSSIRAMFEESRNRITSMALIHENLYQSADLARIDFKKYLENLVQNIAATYCRPQVRICLEMDPLALDVNTGIPCGLIVNELVSNSFKYAFPEGRKGTISLGITKNSEDGYLLSVADNGIGFPEELDFRKTNSMGMQLVTVLAGQIHGTIELTTIEGTHFNIAFPGQKEECNDQETHHAG